MKSSGETKGVYRAVLTSILEEIEKDGAKVGYKFRMTGAKERQYHARALAWGFTRWGVASGFDSPAGEELTVGVSAHHRQGKARLKHGGTVKASGTGVGASVTYGSADAVYFRG